MKHDEAPDLLTKVYPKLGSWLRSFPAGTSVDPAARIPADIVVKALNELAERLTGNFPFHSDIYAGQMLKPPHEIAWAAYALTSLINPNNHALDGGPPTSEMEKEVISQFFSMFGFDDPGLGHLTSSGTIANLEALWVARHLHPQKGIAFSSQAHYTHHRMCEVLGLTCFVIPTDEHGMWDMDYLHQHIAEIGTVVVTMGTTGMGRVEALHHIQPYCEAKNVRIHLDAAYGGYYKLLEENGDIEAGPWSYTAKADSIVIDPHKHGLQPYGCGCILFRDPTVGRFYKHDSPYTYFSSDELHLGEISLECSRAGAAAAALWTTLKVFGLNPGGEMQALLSLCRQAAVDFYGKITRDGNFDVLEQPELDIVVYFPVRQLLTGDAQQSTIKRVSGISAASEAIFRRGMEKGPDGVFVSLYKIPSSVFAKKYPDIETDADSVTVLRSVLMKPGHNGAVDMLVGRLNDLAGGIKYQT